MPEVAFSFDSFEIFSSSRSGCSYLVKMPSRFSTPRPPSSPSSIATSGETTPSIADASRGSSSRCGPSFQPMSTSCGSRVRLDGTIAMSSNPYACLAFFPRPMSISTRYLPLKHKGPGAVAAWAEEPFLLPSLKLDGDRSTVAGRCLAPAEVPDAEDVRAVRDLHRGPADVAVRDERQPVRADCQRRVPPDGPGAVDGRRGGRRAGDIDAVRHLQVEVGPAAVVVRDDAQAVDPDRARRVLADEAHRVERPRGRGRAEDVRAVRGLEVAVAVVVVAHEPEAVRPDRHRRVEAD